MTFTFVIEKDEDSGYVAKCLELRGVYGQGDTEEEAIADIQSALDIALDTYPYHGTTTTCDALWMGVPVISMVGRHHACRVGLSILTRVGLEFFAALTRNEYIARATALAHNLEALVDIRFSMRRRMTESTLCNAGAFAHNVEEAYREMWHKWCKNMVSINQSSTT